MSEPYYIRRKVKAASERGRKMANVRWKLERERMNKLAALTAEQFPSRIIRRIIVIDDERTTREAVIWSRDSFRSAKAKLNKVLRRET